MRDGNRLLHVRACVIVTGSASVSLHVGVRHETVGYFKGEGSCANICILRRGLHVFDWLVAHRLFGFVPTEM
jgi:hypothetical protein